MKKQKITFIAILAQLTLISFASAQEPCSSGCNQPPQTIGAGGITCTKAADAFEDGNGIKKSLNYDARSIAPFTLSSEVYCKSIGVAHLGDRSPTLNFNSIRETPEVIADLENIFGLSNLTSKNNEVVFNEHNDACFSSYQWAQDAWTGWYLPQGENSHYFSYQCRSPARNSDAIICKISYDGKFDIGFQIYTTGSFPSLHPEEILN